MSVKTGLTPQQWGQLDDLDLRELEPGKLLWGRFAVTSPPAFADGAWRVTAVDADRLLGDAPHHCVTLEYLPARSTQRRLLLRALELRVPEMPRLWALFETATGVVTATEPYSDAAPCSEQFGVAVVDALASVTMAFHNHGVAGVRYRLENLRIQEGRVRLLGVGHLAAPTVADEAQEAGDIRELVDALAGFVPSDLAALLDPAPGTSAELISRLHSWQRDETGRPQLPGEPPFVGRRRELEELHRALARARCGHGTCVVVEGERGVGKSRLIRRFVEMLQRDVRPVLVLDGRCPSGSSATRSALGDALAGLADATRVGSLSEQSQIRRRIERQVGGLASVLTRFAPALEALLGPSAGPPVIDLDEDFIRHVRVVADALRVVGTTEMPLILLLDDAEFMDSGSLAVLRDLMRARDHRTLVLLGSRGLATPLMSEAFRIRLAPLTVADVGVLLEETFGAATPEVAAPLHGETGGLPWAVWTTLQAWVEEGRFRGVGGTFRGGASARPANVESLLRRRVLGLSDDAQWLGLLTALRGEQTEPAWLSELSGWAPARTEVAIVEACSAGPLLRSERLVRFPHDLAREAVLAVSEPSEIRRGHAAIAAWLEAQGAGASIAQLAYHAEHAGSEADEKLRSLHLGAGAELLSAYDLQRAGWHFERALAVSPTPEDQTAGLEGLADVAVLSGNPEDAAARYAKVISTHPDLLHAVHVGAKGSHALYAKSEAGLALEVGELALRRAGCPAPATKLATFVRLVAELIGGLFGAPRMDATLRDALCRLYPYVIAASLLQRPLAALAYTLGARRLATGAESSSAAFALTFYAGFRATLGHDRAAEAVLARCEALAAAENDDFVQGVAHHIRGHMVQLPSGLYVEGQRSLDRAVEHFRRSGNMAIAPLSLFFKAAYGRQREAPEQIIAWLDEASTTAQRHGNELSLPMISALKALVETRRGKNVSGETLEDLSLRTADGSAVHVERLLAHMYLALAWLDRDELGQARAQIELAQRIHSELPGSLEICQELHFATARVIVAKPVLDRRDRRALQRAIKRLKKIGRRSPRLAATAEFIQLQVAIRERAPAEARAIANALTQGLPWHGQVRLAEQAEAQVRQAALAPSTPPELAVVPPASPALVPAPASDAATPDAGVPALISKPDERQGTTPVREALAATRTRARQLLPETSMLYFRSDPNLHLRLAPSLAETLFVQMLCAARDAVSSASQLVLTVEREFVAEEVAARVAGARAGEHAAIQVEAGPGPVAPVLGGLAGCQRVVAGLGGFLRTDADERKGVLITAYLPILEPPPSIDDSRGRALVLHRDPRLCQTVSEAMTRLGFECETADGFAAQHFDEADLVLVDCDYAAQVRSVCRDATVIALMPRGRGDPVTPPSLRVPFALQELEALLEDVEEDSSDTAPPIG